MWDEGGKVAAERDASLFRQRDYWTPTTGKSPTTSPSSSRLPYPALALSPTLNPLHESSANTPPKPSKKICRTMSISENPVRRSDARPMRPAQPEKEIYCAKKSTKETP